MEACKVGNSEIVHLLLKHGANPNLANDVSDYECPGCNKMSVNIQEKWNALMEAAKYGKMDITDILLTEGARPNMQDKVSHMAFSVYYV